MPGLDLNTANSLPFSIRYYYALHSSDGLNLTVLRDEAPPKITGGRGGWEVVNRRRRKGLTSWIGRDPLSMDLPVLFNGWYDPPFSIDADKATLMKMADGDNFVNPPTITVEGNIPATGVTWVISNLQWGDNVIWDMDAEGNDILARQDCVISLLQYVQEDVVKVLNQKPQQKTHKIKEGETLRSIAKAQYGDAGKWKLIADANPDIRDPNNLQIGKVDVPAGTKLSHLCNKDMTLFNEGHYSWLNFRKRWKEHECPGAIPSLDYATIVIPPDK